MADDLVERLSVKCPSVTLTSANRRWVWRILGLGVPAAVLSAAIATAVLWWRDRPLADIEGQLERPDGAQRALEAADAFLARNPASDRALALKARALAGLGRWDEASQIFSQVGVRSPQEMRSWATALVHERRFSEAMPLLERLLESEPDDPAALRQVVACRFQMGLTAAALESAERLGRIDGHEVEGLFLAGVIHRARGTTNVALENWARIEALRSDGQGLAIGPAEFFLIYGEDLLLEGLPQTAAAKLKRSRDLEDSLAVQLALGKAWALSGRAAEAAAAWQRALEHDAGNAEARNGLAELALSGGDANEALAWLEPLADHPHISSTTAYLLERVYTLLGNEDELERWQGRTAELRQREKRVAAFRRRLGVGL